MTIKLQFENEIIRYQPCLINSCMKSEPLKMIPKLFPYSLESCLYFTPIRIELLALYEAGLKELCKAWFQSIWIGSLQFMEQNWSHSVKNTNTNKGLFVCINIIHTN